ncbi:uncharacterized protein [Antennarius striatus]|uniref:uncharacterized protein n=1 Tax=Antennarius striatus TaxID=241820 RepID=UPI0035B14BB1
MFKRRFRVAAALLVVVVSPLLLECFTCQGRTGTRSDYPEGRCPMNLTSVLTQEPGGIYSECVSVHVWMKADDFCQAPRIEILSPVRETFRPTVTRRKHTKKCNNKKQRHETRVRCGWDVLQPPLHTNTLWELIHTCVEAEAGSVVSASFSTTSRSCNISYTVPDPVPVFDLSVDHFSKTITVTAAPGEQILARWCYQRSPRYCVGGEVPPQSGSVTLSVPYLLPCVCVQVYYSHTDARRQKTCPFRNVNLTDFRDVWLSSDVTLFRSSLTWHSVCPASDLNVSAALCWRHHEQLCTLAPNSTLEGEEGGQDLIYSTSAVDKHPQMCVQFSLHGSHHVSCPFHGDPSPWEVDVRLGGQNMFLYVTSSVPAKFSAQLCTLKERECTPMGGVWSATMAGNTSGGTLEVPLHVLSEEPCVQVWQSHPFLQGRRILCPDYTHRRCGVFAAALLVVVIVSAMLGIFIHRVIKTGAAGWLCAPQPVLLVCSSDQLAHVSAAFALASILQGELGATVLTALWALCVRTHPGARTGVADLGPIPWLYGQWEAVLKAEGKVLIVWSPEANRIYERWRKEKGILGKNDRKRDEYSRAEVRYQKIRVEVEKFLKLKYNKRKAARQKLSSNLCDGKDSEPQGGSSSVIGPVFTAALACLEGALQGLEDHRVVLVYFQGFCHSRDIPKALGRVPRYCLPQEFSGLVQELGGMRQVNAGEISRNCWPRLLSKVVSLWLARQLARRLQTLLPQRRGRRRREPSIVSSPETPETAQSRIRWPPPADGATPATAQEQEPLCQSPWQPDATTSQVSHI